MKNLILLAAALLLVCCDSQPKKVSDSSSFETTLQALLHDGEYFKLKSELQKYGTILPSEKLKFYKAFVESAFNDPQKSIILAETLLKDVDGRLPDTAIIDLMILLRDNYFKSFQYKKAADVGQHLLANRKKALGNKLHDVENAFHIHNGLKNISPQQIELKTTTVKWNLNKLGLAEIPIKTKKGLTFGIVFDTRAHISTATQSFAKKLGLKMLGASFEESSGITGIKFKAGLGVADSLYIGDVLLKNVVFQVLPDEILHFDAFDFTIDGILGFPVITQLKEIHIRQDGTFIISPSSNANHLSNLAFDGSTTIISAVNDTDTLSFHFDTGATGTEFYGNYFNKFKTKVKRNGKVGTVETGGAGGSKKVQVYTLPTVNLTVGQKKVEIKDIPVRTVASFKGQKYNGNIGQDVIKQFDEMILNFESMYLDFK